MRFPIGFWNYCPIDTPEIGNRPVETVQDWADAGVTLTFAPRYSGGGENRAKLLRVLDEAAGQGIRVLLDDERLSRAWRPAGLREADVREALQKIRQDFGGHPAVVGIHIADEPSVFLREEEVADSIKVARMVREVFPAQLRFVNFLPWEEGYASLALGGPIRRYADVLVDYAQQAGLPVLGFDCYTQMRPGEAGMHSYFKNLEVFEEAARRLGIPFWATLLLTGHFQYEQPTEAALRWQLSSALAHGAKGIMWFFFYNRTMTSRYCLAPIDALYERSERFAPLARVNRTFLSTYADSFVDLQLEKVWHVQRSYANTPLFGENEDESVRFVKVLHSDDGAILSRYRHADGTTYYSLVNNSRQHAAECSVHFRKGLRVVDVCDLGWKQTVEQRPGKALGEETLCAVHWLEPGAMKLWRLG